MSAPADDQVRATGFRLRPTAAALNHLLKRASWARERLQPYAGQVARFEVAPFSVALAILESGEVAEAPATAAPAATFTLTPGIAMRTLAGDATAWQQVATTGDASLAREILYIAQNLRWDVEEDLSRVFGDIAAHRMVATAGELKRWQREAAAGFARATAAYWIDERPLIAAKSDVERFVRAVDTLRDDVARLEKRIGQFAQHVQTPAHR